jgi:hypothetical protein
VEKRRTIKTKINSTKGEKTKTLSKKKRKWAKKTLTKDNKKEGTEDQDSGT